MLCWTDGPASPLQGRFVPSDPDDLIPDRAMLLIPALAYFAPVFAFAFAFGALRVTLIAPEIGALAAVALEVPLILGFSWIVAGRTLRRWPLPRGSAVLMGCLAFLVLMLAEFALAFALSGQTPSAYAATFLTGPGALGLAGQLGFALIPALRTQASG
jgi:phosphoglycerol transferase MdoB-like AlkP superfamily enzyme